MTVKQFLDVVEVRTKIVSISGFAIGTIYAYWRAGRIDPLFVFVMFPAVLAVDMATTALNTFFDYYRGVDRRSINRESNKVVVHGDVPALAAIVTAFVLLLVAAVFGVWLAYLTSLWLLALGAFGVSLGIAYNAGPLPISRLPVGELFAGGALGWGLVSLVAWVHLDGFAAGDLLVGLPSLLLVASILTTNNTCDAVGDELAGRRTLSIVIGARNAERLIYLLGIGSFGLLLLLSLVGRLPRLGIATSLGGVFVCIPIYRLMSKTGYAHKTKDLAMARISLVFVIFTLAVLVAFMPSLV